MSSQQDNLLLTEQSNIDENNNDDTELNVIQNKSDEKNTSQNIISKSNIDNSSKGMSVKEVDDSDKNIDQSPKTIAAPITASEVAESKSGGYSFVGGKIFKVTQDAKSTCVRPSTADEVKNDTVFINSMKTTLEIKTGGSRSANKKNKTCKKKGGKKHKKSQKHKKANKC
jgi:hypothetical protein